MKFCELCGIEIDTIDGENRCKSCDLDTETKARKARRNANRREREDALRSLGLVKVRGSMGGTYFE